MLSKKQAEAASQALIHSERQQSDSNSGLLARFPELAAFPAGKRSTALKVAQSQAWRKWPALLAAAALFAFSAVWLWSMFVSDGDAEKMWWLPLAAVVLLRQVVNRQTRLQLVKIREAPDALDR